TEAGEHTGNLVEQLASEITDRTDAPSQPLAGRSVDVHAPHGGLERVRAARRQAGDDPGGDVTRSGRAEPRVAGAVAVERRSDGGDPALRCTDRDDSSEAGRQVISRITGSR